MHGLEIRPLASFAQQAWRNGGGTTRPLAEDARGAWRVSLASVERDGPYSRFADMARLSLVLQGAGVTLRDDAVQCPLRRGVVAEYDGDIAWNASLLDGPVLALNAMVERGAYRARLHPLMNEIAVPVPRGCFAVALTMGAPCTLDIDGATSTLEAAHVLLRDEHGPALRVASPGDMQAALAIVERI
jgi:uncharacterized protein